MPHTRAIVLAALLATGSALAQPATTAAPAAAQPAAVADVSDLLPRMLTAYDVPALGVVVVQGGSVIAEGASGVRKRGTEAHVTTGDLWHLGSCTKSMTATLCAMLVEDGTLAWDTSLLSKFPELKETAAPTWDAVTLEQLLTQTAGAPQDLHKDKLWGRLWKREGTPTQQRLNLLTTVIAWPPDHVPGSAFKYSNTNFAIAGALAERATGQDWETLIQRRLFAPLGITSAGFGTPGDAAALDQPWGHTAAGAPIAPGPMVDNPPAIGPGGTVHMTLRDWAKYAALHAHGERSGATTLLKPETFVRLHTPAKDSYACGWAISPRPWAGPTGRVFTHSGSNNMWYAVVWIAPEKDMAIVAACNQGGEKAARACDAASAAMVSRFIANAPVITAPAASPAPTGR